MSLLVLERDQRVSEWCMVKQEAPFSLTLAVFPSAFFSASLIPGNSAQSQFVSHLLTPAQDGLRGLLTHLQMLQTSWPNPAGPILARVLPGFPLARSVSPRGRTCECLPPASLWFKSPWPGWGQCSWSGSCTLSCLLSATTGLPSQEFYPCLPGSSCAHILSCPVAAADLWELWVPRGVLCRAG